MRAVLLGAVAALGLAGFATAQVNTTSQWPAVPEPGLTEFEKSFRIHMLMVEIGSAVQAEVFAGGCRARSEAYLRSARERLEERADRVARNYGSDPWWLGYAKGAWGGARAVAYNDALRRVPDAETRAAERARFCAMVTTGAVLAPLDDLMAQR